MSEKMSSETINDEITENSDVTSKTEINSQPTATESCSEKVKKNFFRSLPDNRPVSWILTVILFLAIMFATLTFSIGLPIYFRPFYYIQIDTLNMVEETDYSRETIKEAYDEVLDFLTIGTPFGTGDLAWSESGKSHFEDCKVLFDLNFWVFIVSAVLCVAMAVLAKLKKIKLIKLRGFPPYFYSGAVLLGLFVVIGGIASIDFDTTFVVFHTIFFPGKTNWVFNSRTDQIIRVMPEEFFLNCAILIICSLAAICILLIVFGALSRKKNIAKAQEVKSE